MPSEAAQSLFGGGRCAAGTGSLARLCSISFRNHCPPPLKAMVASTLRERDASRFATTALAAAQRHDLTVALRRSSVSTASRSLARCCGLSCPDMRRDNRDARDPS